MLTDGVIHPSMSLYRTYPVLVPKKGTTDFRFCVDYRALNKETVDNKTPLPRVIDLLQEIQSSKFFATFDLCAGYWQIPLSEKDCHKTAFSTHHGHFEFVILPFDLKNVPRCFQA